MKFLSRTMPLAFLLLAWLVTPALAEQKIGTVNLRTLFDNYWKTKTAQAALNDRKAELSKEDRGFLDDLKKAKDEYQKLLEAANDQAVSGEERAKRQRAAEDKLKQIQDSEQTIAQFERQAQATLADQSQRMRSDILKEIRGAVDDKARAGGYTLVFDIAAETANQTPFLLYTSTNDNDLTAAVLAQLNAGAPINVNTTSTTTNSSSPLLAPIPSGTTNTGAGGF
ncbi:MAG: OmpH family outer membrane protein [Verrucomicrobiota bacterium]|nr:OmpH family outer membrane protein [Verrucomicrobiota bacterium]